MMNKDDEKYGRILQVLRESKPKTPDPDLIEDEVIRQISKKTEAVTGFFDLLFSWIYIRWVRRCLVAASFALLGFFLWQQNSILNQIDDLSRQVRRNNRIITYDPSSALEKQQVMLRLSGKSKGQIMIPEEDLQMLFDSLNRMNIRYRDILELINEDPDLKKMIEEKLESKLQSRLKL